MTRSVSISRRSMLQAASTALALPVVAQVAQAATFRWPESVWAPGEAPATPDEALAALKDGNARFAAGKPEAPHRDLARRRAVAAGQKPFAAFLGCADSRVPIEIVFDQGFGDLFPTRIAGNIVTAEIIGSLEFGTLVLGAKALVVLGHSSCGAVAATIAGNAVPGQISVLYSHLQEAADDAQGDLPKAIELNVRRQVRLLRRASPVLAELVRDGKLQIVGAVYDVASGQVRFLD
jgi:carbonic anhydrase